MKCENCNEELNPRFIAVRDEWICENCLGVIQVRCPFFNICPQYGNEPDYEDDSYDHNTFWGGAGPDCIDKRLEAAKA